MLIVHKPKISFLILLYELHISSDANLQLLFTVVESAPSETVRSNCTIALGDLVVRFPNLLEPWTEHMYARLSDTSVAVRKNAVLVLSHLILNDMMKVWKTRKSFHAICYFKIFCVLILIMTVIG